MDWIYTAFFSIGLFIVIISTGFLQKKLNWSPNVTRKMVHIITGFFVASTPFLFDSNIPIIVISSVFTVITFISVKYGFLPGLNSVGRQSYGTVFYPISLIILLIFLWANYPFIIVLAMLVLAIADPVAAIVGERLTNAHRFRLAYDEKSLEGSLLMFLTTSGIIFLGLKTGTNLFIETVRLTTLQCFWTAFIVGIIATVCEAMSSYGSDNLSVPLGVAFALHFMLTRFGTPAANENLQFTVGLVLAALVALLTFYLKFLNNNGAVATFLLGTVVFGIGGWKFSIPILVFFILSSLLSKLGKKRKKKLAQTFQKSSRRDLGQVAANGGMAGLLVILWNYYPNDYLFYLYLGALSAVTADTWATEIGFFAKELPRLILNFKPVPQGTSGGLTVLGTMASTLGATTIAYAGWFHFPKGSVTFTLIIIIVSAGLLSSLFDSLLGATVQAQYKCPKCGKITEKRTHCDNVKTSLHSGFSWMDNDFVNFLASVFGALIVWVELYMFNIL